tara:strand:+ start:183 stop:758 length:576 start_codon:yes stop_codon:yes gene_type:complete
MHYCFHHIPKTGGSSLRIRLEDRADKKQISKFDYAIGHNTTKRTPGIHFVWLREPLDRDISHFNYDMEKGEANSDNFEESYASLAGNFMILWMYKNYLLNDHNVDIETKYHTVRQSLKNNFTKVFCTKNFEDSWNYVADTLEVDREPRLSTNRSNEDYKKYADRKNLSKDFIAWHRAYNLYDYKLYEEFCT